MYEIEVTAAVNPARAGMIPRKDALIMDENSKPRASGDDPGGPDGDVHR